MIFESAKQDLRFAVRSLRRRPLYAAVVVATLALGIGANTAIFSVVEAVLLRPLPYERGDEIVVIRQEAKRRGIENLQFSVKEIQDFRTGTETLSSLVEYHTMSFTLLGRAEPLRVQVGVVSPEFFDVFGVKPLFGRAFVAEDDAPGAEAVLALSFDFWQRSLGGDADIVGRVFEMNDRPHTVVGILPKVPQYPNENDVYMPTSACPFRSAPALIANRTGRLMSVFGRLRPGTDLERARSDMERIAGRLRTDYTDAYPESYGYTASAYRLRDELTQRARPTFLVLLGTVGLVLLIACANVANLALSRASEREGELAVRTALGAGRGRLARELLTESTLLALAGGMLGFLLASAGVDLLVAFAARFSPRAVEIRLDGSVLTFTLGISLLTGILVGAVPALAPRRRLASALSENLARTGSRRSGQFRAVLVVAQVAASVTLLVGAGLMLRSLFALQRVDPGFRPEGVLSARLSLNWSRYTEDQKVREFYRALVEKLRAIPEVRSVALSIFLPLAPSRPFNQEFRVEGRAAVEGEAVPVADLRLASPDYFATMGIPLLRGRFFTDQDDAQSLPVAVVNQSMARRHWGSEDPVGRRVSLDSGRRWLEVVGVVGDVRQYGLDRPPSDELYRAFDQAPSGGAAILIRTQGDPARLTRQLRDAVYAVDPDQPVDRIRPLEAVRGESLASSRTTAFLLAVFAAVALAITASGIFGVMALLVDQRTREIGIRMALGAERSGVIQMVLREATLLVAIGLGLGFAGALTLSRAMSSVLYGVGSTDVVTYAVVGVATVVVAVLACFTPARRAASVSPLVALRST